MAIRHSHGRIELDERVRRERHVQVRLGAAALDDPVVSPLRADLTGLPPLLVQAATGDLVLCESRLLVDRATAHGVDARLELYPADTHVLHVFWSFLPEAGDALQQAGSFIRERLEGLPERARDVSPGA